MLLCFDKTVVDIRGMLLCFEKTIVDIRDMLLCFDKTDNFIYEETRKR
jgi:hypothetical protein